MFFNRKTGSMDFDSSVDSGVDVSRMFESDVGTDLDIFRGVFLTPDDSVLATSLSEIEVVNLIHTCFMSQPHLVHDIFKPGFTDNLQSIIASLSGVLLNIAGLYSEGGIVSHYLFFVGKGLITGDGFFDEIDSPVKFFYNRGVNNDVRLFKSPKGMVLLGCPYLGSVDEATFNSVFSSFYSKDLIKGDSAWDYYYNSIHDLVVGDVIDGVFDDLNLNEMSDIEIAKKLLEDSGYVVQVKSSLSKSRLKRVALAVKWLRDSEMSHKNLFNSGFGF